MYINTVVSWPLVVDFCSAFQAVVLVITMGPTWIVSFLLLLSGSQSQQFRNQELIYSSGSGQQTLAKWKNIINEQSEENGKFIHLLSLIKKIFVALESSSFPTAVAKNISQQCLEDSQFYVRNLYSNRTLWALQSKLFYYHPFK